MYLVKTPFWLRWLYPTLIWRQQPLKKVIYLTFDDGPIPVVTPFVLETLKKFQAKATFFCIGENVSKFPEVYQQVLTEGHHVGNHTFNHLKGWKTDTNDYIENIKKCAELVESDLFRPPYGRIKFNQIRDLNKQIPNLKIIMWDVLSGDFDITLSPEACLQNLIKNTESGSIVVFHDSLKAQPRLEYALPKALEYWTEQGYSFESIV